MYALVEKENGGGDLADRLKTIRQRLRLTQEEMAVKLGASRATYKNWEYGVAKPPQRAVAEIALLDAEVVKPAIPAYELDVPLRTIGAIAASQKVDWTDPFESDDFEYVPGHMAGERGRFTCRVASDSMMPLLQPNDLCIWQHSPIPRINAVILYRHPDRRVTIKQLKHDGTHYLLHPLNEAYDEERGEGEQVGYLVGYVRKVGTFTMTAYDPDGIRP